MTYAFIIPWLVALISPSPALAKMDEEMLSNTKYAIEQAMKYNVDPEKLVKLMDCESLISYQEGDKNPKTGKFESLGILQFQKPTWNQYSKIYGVKGKYPDAKPEIELTAKMIGDNPDLAHNWWRCAYRIGLVDDPPIYRK